MLSYAAAAIGGIICFLVGCIVMFVQKLHDASDRDAHLRDVEDTLAALIEHLPPCNRCRRVGLYLRESDNQLQCARHRTAGSLILRFEPVVEHAIRLLGHKPNSTGW